MNNSKTSGMGFARSPHDPFVQPLWTATETNHANRTTTTSTMNNHHNHESQDSESTVDPETLFSPATQTLYQLSQEQGSMDLQYDLSQLEYDVARALVNTRHASPSSSTVASFTHRTELVSSTIQSQALEFPVEKHQGSKARQARPKASAKNKRVVPQQKSQHKAPRSTRTRPRSNPRPSRTTSSPDDDNTQDDDTQDNTAPDELQGDVVGQPHDNDILCVRGNLATQHPGNQKFNALIEKHKRDYFAPDSYKQGIVKNVLQDMQALSPPSRFLSPRGSQWVLVGDAFARDKVRKALSRGGPPKKASSPTKKKRVPKKQTATKSSTKSASGSRAPPPVVPQANPTESAPPTKPCPKTLLGIVGNYEIHSICIPSEGSLGLTIEKMATLPQDLRTCLTIKTEIPPDFQWCLVDTYQEDGLGKASGILPGDWFVHHVTCKNRDPPIRLEPISYRQVKTIATKNARPISYTVARRVTNSENGRVSNNIVVETSAPAAAPVSEKPTQSKPKSAKPVTKEPLQPKTTQPTTTQSKTKQSKTTLSKTTQPKTTQSKPKPSKPVTKESLQPKTTQPKTAQSKTTQQPQSEPTKPATQELQKSKPTTPATQELQKSKPTKPATQELQKPKPSAIEQGKHAQNTKKQVPVSHATPLTDCAQVQDSSTTTVPSLPTHPTPVNRRRTMSRAKKDSSAVPFCQKCNHPEKQRSLHHPWCPENPQFENSGADEILEKLQEGCQVGCERCRHEYKTGRSASNMEHNTACTSNAAKQPTTNKDPKNIKSKTPTVQNKRVKFQDQVDNTSVVKRGNQENSRKRKKSTHETNSDQAGWDIPSINRGVDGGKLTASWGVCDDPWGAEEDSEDVVVFAPFRKSQSLDALFHCSPRFESNPFSDSLCYQRTHFSPAEGFQALLLVRDIMCTRPWGFSIYRHEFGGACLVQTVDPVGPASSASFVGDNGNSQDSGLRPNDMVIAVNGKLTGGMSVDLLRVEIETTGAELVLLVSRYKFASDVQKYEQQTERASLHQIDSDMADDTLLEWTQLGDQSEKGPFPLVEENCGSVEAHRHDQQSTNSNENGARENLEPLEPSLEMNLEEERASTDEGFVNATNAMEDGTGLLLEQDGQAKNDQCEQRDEPTTCFDQAPSNDPGLPSCHDTTSAISKQESDHDSSSSASEDEESKDGSSACETEDEDDGNAWMGCICGKIHQKLRVFWLQCDGCAAWYNLATRCAGFDEEHAKTLPDWLCPCCSEVHNPDNDNKSSAETCSQSIARSGNDEAATKKDDNVVMTSVQLAAELDEDSGGGENPQVSKEKHGTRTAAKAMSPKAKEPAFAPGTVVDIQEHAWPGCNNPAGIAKILKSYVDDEDGDLCYDIKYIIGNDKRVGVLAQYVEKHLF